MASIGDAFLERETAPAITQSDYTRFGTFYDREYLEDGIGFDVVIGIPPETNIVDVRFGYFNATETVPFFHHYRFSAAHPGVRELIGFCLPFTADSEIRFIRISSVVVDISNVYAPFSVNPSVQHDLDILLAAMRVVLA